MIYDFYGFPKALSEVQYPAKGSPELVAQVQELLADTDLKVDPERGFDHGAWAVLKFLYPKAEYSRSTTELRCYQACSMAC